MIKRERHFASSSTRKGLIPLVVGALAVGGVACGTMAAWKLWVDARNSAQLTAASFGVVFAEQTDRALQPVSLAVQDIRAFLQPSDYTDAEAFLAAAKSADVHSMLVDKVAGIPQAAVLSIVGIHGNVLNTTAPVATAEINVDRSDRDYAAYCRKAAHGSPFIGMTVIGRSSGQKVFPLVYCLDGADGRPLGLILAGVSVSYFMNFYETIGLPPGSSIAVRQPNGEALVRFPTTGPTAPEAMVSTARDDRFVARSRLTGYPLQIGSRLLTSHRLRCLARPGHLDHRRSIVDFRLSHGAHRTARRRHQTARSRKAGPNATQCRAARCAAAI